MLFRVIHGHLTDFDTNRFRKKKRKTIKPICDLLIVNNTNLHHISLRFQVIADYWSYFHVRKGRPLFNTFVQAELLTHELATTSIAYGYTCDFLLMINTNLHLFSHSHCFQVIADYW